jgi:hypothetical protein
MGSDQPEISQRARILLGWKDAVLQSEAAIKQYGTIDNLHDAFWHTVVREDFDLDCGITPEAYYRNFNDQFKTGREMTDAEALKQPLVAKHRRGLIQYAMGAAGTCQMFITVEAILEYFTKNLRCSTGMFCVFSLEVRCHL